MGIGVVNCPWYCADCIHSKREADQMVGDVRSGGSEEAYSCSENMNMKHFWFYGTQCPKFDDGEFDNYGCNY